MRHLDRDLLVDPGVLREVDGAESAAAERRDDLVFTEQLTLEEQCDGNAGPEYTRIAAYNPRRCCRGFRAESTRQRWTSRAAARRRSPPPVAGAAARRGRRDRGLRRRRPRVPRARRQRRARRRRAAAARAKCRPSPEPAVRLTLAQAVIKGEKMDDVVRDATMMGVAAIEPLSPSTPPSHIAARRRADRWRRIAIASAKQCRRAVVPLIGAARARRLDRAGCRARAAAAGRAVGQCRRTRRSRTIGEQPVPHPRRCWSDRRADGAAEEIDAAVGAGYVPITLGRRTLRADAVPIVAIAAAAVRVGDSERSNGFGSGYSQMRQTPPSRLRRSSDDDPRSGRARVGDDGHVVGGEAADDQVPPFDDHAVQVARRSAPGRRRSGWPGRRRRAAMRRVRDRRG